MLPTVNNTDSLKLLKNGYDSLQTVIKSSRNLWPFKLGEPPVQASIIIAIVTIITVILGFLFKDYWIPRLITARNKREEGQAIFKRYKNNIFNAAYSFAHRLDEIYRNRSHYLWSEMPSNNFYEYKYKSTVYRLCVLLGWIRAYQLEESSITIKKRATDLHNISGAIKNFSSSLADGQSVEMYVAKAICKLNGINPESFKNGVLQTFSIEIDHLVQEIHSAYGPINIYESNEQLKEEFIRRLTDLMKSSGIECDTIHLHKEEITRIVSIKLALIYRDWQQAIGDLMLRKDSSLYTVIGYGQFEELFAMDASTSERKWLERAEKMFRNLDLRKDESLDSRINQLQRIYSGVYALLDVLYKINIGVPPISESDFNRIPQNIKVPTL